FSCAAALQGPYNVERGRVYYEYLKHYYGPEITNTHLLAIVQGVGHDPSAIFNSEAGIQHVFAPDPSRCPPRAVMSLTRQSGESPLEVGMDGSGSSTPDGTQIIGYKWDFGDGTTAVGSAAEHTYYAPGIFVATLTVTNDAGCSSV